MTMLINLLLLLLVMPVIGIVWLMGVFWFIWQWVSGESYRRDNGL